MGKNKKQRAKENLEKKTKNKDNNSNRYTSTYKKNETVIFSSIRATDSKSSKIYELKSLKAIVHNLQVQKKEIESLFHQVEKSIDYAMINIEKSLTPFTTQSSVKILGFGFREYSKELDKYVIDLNKKLGCANKATIEFEKEISNYAIRNNIINDLSNFMSQVSPLGKELNKNVKDLEIIDTLFRGLLSRWNTIYEVINTNDKLMRNIISSFKKTKDDKDEIKLKLKNRHRLPYGKPKLLSFSDVFIAFDYMEDSNKNINPEEKDLNLSCLKTFYRFPYKVDKEFLNLVSSKKHCSLFKDLEADLNLLNLQLSRMVLNNYELKNTVDVYNYICDLSKYLVLNENNIVITLSRYTVLSNETAVPFLCNIANYIYNINDYIYKSINSLLVKECETLKSEFISKSMDNMNLYSECRKLDPSFYYDLLDKKDVHNKIFEDKKDMIVNYFLIHDAISNQTRINKELKKAQSIMQKRVLAKENHPLLFSKKTSLTKTSFEKVNLNFITSLYDFMQSFEKRTTVKYRITIENGIFGLLIANNWKYKGKEIQNIIKEPYECLCFEKLNHDKKDEISSIKLPILNSSAKSTDKIPPSINDHILNVFNVLGIEQKVIDNEIKKKSAPGAKIKKVRFNI